MYCQKILWEKSSSSVKHIHTQAKYSDTMMYMYMSIPGVIQFESNLSSFGRTCPFAKALRMLSSASLADLEIKTNTSSTNVWQLPEYNVISTTLVTATQHIGFYHNKILHQQYTTCSLSSCIGIWIITKEENNITTTNYRKRLPLCWFIFARGATPSTAIKNTFLGLIIRNSTLCGKNTKQKKENKINTSKKK